LTEEQYLDYLVTVALAHGLTYDEAMSTPVRYLELLDAYQAATPL